MADDSKSDKYEHLTHQFHEKYRTAGIALCISLATVASAEGWWFYSFIEEIKNVCVTWQGFLYGIVLLSGIVLFSLSFLFQFLHYYGTQHMARAFFYRYKLTKNLDSNIIPYENDLNKEWGLAQDYFDHSDFLMKWFVSIVTFTNFSTALLYIILYQPHLHK